MGQLERSPEWHAQAQFRKILAVWPQVVGPAVSQHSRPTGIRQGILQVAVSSAAWSQTLTLERRFILQKLHPHLLNTDGVSDLRFSPGRWASFPQGTPLSSRESGPFPAGTSLAPMSQRERPATADAAFHDWSQRLRSQQAHQPVCPQCHCPCPAVELQRWAVCALCATQQWQHQSAGRYDPRT